MAVTGSMSLLRGLRCCCGAHLPLFFEKIALGGSYGTALRKGVTDALLKLRTFSALHLNNLGPQFTDSSIFVSFKCIHSLEIRVILVHTQFEVISSDSAHNMSRHFIGKGITKQGEQYNCKIAKYNIISN